MSGTYYYFPNPVPLYGRRDSGSVSDCYPRLADARTAISLTAPPLTQYRVPDDFVYTNGRGHQLQTTFRGLRSTVVRATSFVLSV